METALVTGMLETEFLPMNRAKMDVKESNTESFSAVFKSSLKKTDVVEGKDVEKTEDSHLEVGDGEKPKDVEDIDQEDDVDELKDEDTKKDKKSKKDNLIFQNQGIEFVRKDVEIKKEDVNLEDVIIEDVNSENKEVINLVGSIKNGELTITPEEKLDNLLNKLDVKLTNNVEIKDESEKVIKVGPQSVETEKIKLNIKDVKSELNEKNLENNLFVSEKENFNNPEIQNPFKIKSTEKVEINEENREVVFGEDNIELDLSKDVINKTVQGKDVKHKDVKENEDVKNIEDDSEIFGVEGHTQMSENGLDNGDSETKDSDKKEDKVKLKDFRTKKEVDFSDRLDIEKDVKLENKFEIKEVNNIRKFENLNFEQDVLDQVTEKLEVSLFDNKSEMVIKLKPNDLGKVTVKISIENGVMNAKFLADSIKVKEALESNLNNLKESLKEQGLNVQDLNVSVDSGRSQNQAFEQSNLRFFNNQKENKVDDVVSYEDTYYGISNINTNDVRNYWMDSTVSFLA